MDTTQGTCRTCGSPIPATCHPGTRYCGARCKNRAKARRRRGQPINDPLRTPEETQQLQATADRIARENARLRKLVTRIHATRQKWQTKASNADARIATERRHTEESVIAAAERAAAAKNREAEAQVQLVRYRERVIVLERQLAALKKAEEDRDTATDVARKIGQNLKTERKRAAWMRRHFLILAGRYFRIHAPETWDEFDHDIYDTYRQLRPPQSTPRPRPKTAH